MSQNVDTGPGFDLCQKRGRFLLILHDYLSRIHKIKTRTT